MMSNTNHSRTPIFICGLPRSGTTLLVTHLDSHPDLMVFPEETLFRRVSTMTFDSRDAWMDYALKETNISILDTEREVSEMERMGGTGIVDYQGFHFDTFAAQARERFAQSAGQPPDLLDSIMGSYAQVTGQEEKRYYVEKTPANEFRIHRYLTWWPQTRFIYILRDPRAAYLSVKTKRERENREQTVEAFVLSWARSMQAWIRHVAPVNAGVVVRYEDVVQYKEHTMRRLCDFLDIPFDPILLQPTKNGQPWVGISSSGQEVASDQQTLGAKWKSALSDYEVQMIEAFLGKMMVAFGYQLTMPLVSARKIFSMALKQKQVGKVELLRATIKLYAPFETFWTG